MSKTISFTLALNAGPSDVAEVIDAINDFFGVSNSGTVTPTEVATASVPAATASAEVDKNGLPWDERIHSSNKAKNADGTWRARRGVDASLKAKVEKELAKTMAAAPAPAAEAAPVAAVPSVPGLPPVPGANAVNPAYTAFVEFIVQNTQSASNPQGRLTDDWVKQVLTNYGVADGSMQNLAHRPDLIPTIEAGIRQALGQ